MADEFGEEFDDEPYFLRLEIMLDWKKHRHPVQMNPMPKEMFLKLFV